MAFEAYKKSIEDQFDKTGSQSRNGGLQLPNLLNSNSVSSNKSRSKPSKMNGSFKDSTILLEQISRKSSKKSNLRLRGSQGTVRGPNRQRRVIRSRADKVTGTFDNIEVGNVTLPVLDSKRELSSKVSKRSFRSRQEGVRDYLRRSSISQKSSSTNKYKIKPKLLDSANGVLLPNRELRRSISRHSSRKQTPLLKKIDPEVLSRKSGNLRRSRDSRPIIYREDTEKSKNGAPSASNVPRLEIRSVTENSKNEKKKKKKIWNLYKGGSTTSEYTANDLLSSSLENTKYQKLTDKIIEDEVNQSIKPPSRRSSKLSRHSSQPPGSQKSKRSRRSKNSKRSKKSSQKSVKNPRKEEKTIDEKVEIWKKVVRDRDMINRKMMSKVDPNAGFGDIKGDYISNLYYKDVKYRENEHMGKDPRKDLNTAGIRLKDPKRAAGQLLEECYVFDWKAMPPDDESAVTKTEYEDEQLKRLVYTDEFLNGGLGDGDKERDSRDPRYFLSELEGDKKRLAEYIGFE